MEQSEIRASATDNEQKRPRIKANNLYIAKCAFRHISPYSILKIISYGHTDILLKRRYTHTHTLKQHIPSFV